MINSVHCLNILAMLEVPKISWLFYLHNSGKSLDDFRLIGSGYRLYESEKTVPNEISTKITPNGMHLFTCEDAKSVPSPSCTVNEPFGDDFGVIYNFSRNYMDEAADIDSRLHALLRYVLKEMIPQRACEQ